MRRWGIWTLLWIAAYVCAAQTCVPGGGVTCTPNLNLWLPPSNYPNWNVPTNANWTTVDTNAADWARLSAVNQTFTGNVTINGSLHGANGVFTGPISAQSASFTGSVTTSEVIASGLVIGSGIVDTAITGAPVIGTDVSGALRLVPTTGSGSAAFQTSPAFLGTPIAPTAPPGTNTTQLATTAFVVAAVSGGGLVPDVNITVPSFAVPSNQCYGSAASTTPATFSMTGLVVGMKVSAGDTGNPTAITGWGASGGLNIRSWVSAPNQGSYIVCNTTAGSITGGAITFVMGAQ